jgi:hypothetical protein
MRGWARKRCDGPEPPWSHPFAGSFLPGSTISIIVMRAQEQDGLEVPEHTTMTQVGRVRQVDTGADAV